MHLRAPTIKPSTSSSPHGGSATTISKTSKKQAKSQQRTIFTDASSLKKNGGESTMKQLRRTAISALENDKEGTAEKIVNALLHDNGYQPSQFFRRSVEHKLATGACFMRELLPALDRGMAHVYYGPRDIGKTTAVNEGLRGYKGVVTGDKLIELFEVSKSCTNDLERPFEVALKAYRKATDDVPLLVIDENEIHCRNSTLVNWKHSNLLDICYISSHFGTAANLKKAAGFTYSVFPRMSDDELSAELTRVSSLMGADKAMKNTRHARPRGMFSFFNSPTTNHMTFYQPLLSGEDIQEIVKNIGPDMSEVMACISQASHNRKVSDYIASRETEATIKLTETMDRMSDHKKEVAKTYLNAFCRQTPMVKEVDIYEEKNALADKYDLMESLRMLAEMDVLAFTTCQQRAVTVPNKLTVKAYSKLFFSNQMFKNTKKRDL